MFDYADDLSLLRSTCFSMTEILIIFERYGQIHISSL